MEYLDFREALMRHVCVDVVGKLFGLDKEINCEDRNNNRLQIHYTKKGKLYNLFDHNKFLWCLRCSTMLLFLSSFGISL